MHLLRKGRRDMSVKQDLRGDNVAALSIAAGAAPCSADAPIQPSRKVSFREGSSVAGASGCAGVQSATCPTSVPPASQLTVVHLKDMSRDDQMPSEVHERMLQGTREEMFVTSPLPRRRSQIGAILFREELPPVRRPSQRRQSEPADHVAGTSSGSPMMRRMTDASTGYLGHAASGGMTNSAGSFSGQEEYIQRSLQFLVLHFILVYLLQVIGQFVVVTLDLANFVHAIELPPSGDVSLIVADFVVTLLLIVEICAQAFVAGGISSYMCSRVHRSMRIFDVLTAVLSLTIITFDVLEFNRDVLVVDSPEDTGHDVLLAVDLVRSVLRTVRLYVFLRRLYMLLKEPLDHLSVLADDMVVKDENLELV